MKPKIDLDKIAEMTYVEYEKMFRKEVIRAQKLGQTNCVVLSDFEFKDQTVGTLVILGHYTGRLTKFYKQIKRSRKDKKDFAVGTAVFEQLLNASSTLHIHLEDGKAKPKKLLKNGKKLFKKSGLAVDIFVGQATEEQDAMLSESEETLIEQEAQKASDKRSIKKLVNSYLKYLALVKDNAIPNLQQNKSIPRDLQLVRQLYILVEAVEAEIPQLSPKEKEEWLNKATAIVGKKEQMSNLYKRVKSALAATNNGMDLNVIVDPPYNIYYELVEEALGKIPPIVNNLEAIVQDKQTAPDAINTTVDLLSKELQDLISKSPQYEEKSRAEELTQAKNNLEYSYNNYLAWQEEQKRLALQLEEAKAIITKKEQLLRSFQVSFDRLISSKNSQELLPHEQGMLERQQALLQELLTISQQLPEQLQQDFAPQQDQWQQRLAALTTIKNTYTLATDLTNIQGRYGAMPTIDPNASPEQQAAQVEALEAWLEKIKATDNEVGDQVLSYYNDLSQAQRQPGGDCFAVAKTRVKKVWKEVTGTDLYDNLPPSPLPNITSSKFFNMVWNCNANKNIPDAYNGLGSAGAMAWAGKGDLVTEDEIWAGKLEAGAVIQVWAKESDFLLVKEGKSTESYGHSFIFLEYVYEDGAISAMKIADQGTGWDSENGIGQYAFEFWIGANLK